MSRVMFVLLLVWPSVIAAQGAAWRAGADAFFSEARADSVVGSALVLVRDGKVVAERYEGFADRERGQKEAAETIHHWASITKTLTAISVMQLRDHGLVSLGDPVVRWVPELRAIHADSGAIERITIQMLLSHTGGFRNGTWPFGSGAEWEPFEPTQWSQLVAMFPYTRLVLHPGERYSYSNPAYIYLAKVIERVTGDPWEEYVHKNIFQPLGMGHSYFRATPWYLREHRGSGYSVVNDTAARRLGGSAASRPAVQANGREFDPGVTVPNSGWNAPIGDLVKYAAFLTGSAPNDGVLTRATLEEMWATVVPTGTGSYDSDPRNSMGLGLFVFEREGRKLVGHTGDQGGYRSLLYLDPERRVAAIGLWNTDNPADGRASAERLKRAQEAVLMGVARLE